MTDKTDKCMFLRECVCLKPGPGICIKCGEEIKYSAQEDCWYCDCKCGNETCVVNRNPSGKYFKIENTEELFNDFKYLEEAVGDLCYIVQNDMILTDEDFEEWMSISDALIKELKSTRNKIKNYLLSKVV
jgi:hypothetical protein